MSHLDWPVPGYPRYTAHPAGTVSHVNRGVLPGKLDPRGYRVVGLYAGRKRTFYKVQRLILLTFIGPPPIDTYHASHMNGDPTDNRLANLAWESPEANNARKIVHGTYGKALDLAAVVAMREAYTLGAKPADLARLHGVNVSAIRAALTGRTWGRVPGAVKLTRRR